MSWVHMAYHLYRKEYIIVCLLKEGHRPGLLLCFRFIKLFPVVSMVMPRNVSIFCLFIQFFGNSGASPMSTRSAKHALQVSVTLVKHALPLSMTPVRRAFPVSMTTARACFEYP
jgi:hypothetical protein